jgi:colanic acid biosynthesis glycosyl transferase WcaI
MRFLILGLNYLPESTSIGPYTADLAESLAAHGHQVHVVTGFPIAPQWRIWESYRGRWAMREMINTIPILRTFLYVPSQPKKALQRVLFDLSFSLSALLGGILVGPVDLIVVISPPLQLGLTGFLLGLVKRAPLFFHIQDLVPDAAVATGMLLENSWAVRLARAIERFIYRQAIGIGVISDGFMHNLVAKGVPHKKIAVLPNYIDLQFLKTNECDNGFRRQHHISPDEFLVMYSGSIALKQGLQTFVETSAGFCQEDGITFYLIGEGPYLQDLKKLAETLKLTNFHFLPLQPRERLPVQLSAADALVITQKRAVTDVVFPGKLLYYMAAGRPILAAVSSDSETGRFISSHKVGIVVPPEDPKTLAEAIRYLRQNPTETERLGRNGRRVVEEKFDRKVVLERFTNYLEALHS